MYNAAVIAGDFYNKTTKTPADNALEHNH